VYSIKTLAESTASSNIIAAQAKSLQIIKDRVCLSHGKVDNTTDTCKSTGPGVMSARHMVEYEKQVLLKHLKDTELVLNQKGACLGLSDPWPPVSGRGSGAIQRGYGRAPRAAGGARDHPRSGGCRLTHFRPSRAKSAFLNVSASRTEDRVAGAGQLHREGAPGRGAKPLGQRPTPSCPKRRSENSIYLVISSDSTS